MKKVLIGVIILSLLAGCGGIKTHSEKEKEKIKTEVYGDFGYNVKNEEAKAKLDKILENLQAEAIKGNEKAIKELEEWDAIIPMKPINEKVNKKIGTWD